MDRKFSLIGKGSDDSNIFKASQEGPVGKWIDGHIIV